MYDSKTIAAVIPSYRVTRHILAVIASIGPEVGRIYVVDDKCPDGSGAFVRANCGDQRVQVLEHSENQGVGGAVMTGYAAAMADGAKVMIKIDGDGQMDGSLIPNFIAPILAGQADYAKGNRFFDLEQVRMHELANFAKRFEFLPSLPVNIAKNLESTGQTPLIVGFPDLTVATAAELPDQIEIEQHAFGSQP